MIQYGFDHSKRPSQFNSTEEKNNIILRSDEGNRFELFLLLFFSFSVSLFCFSFFFSITLPSAHACACAKNLINKNDGQKPLSNDKMLNPHFKQSKNIYLFICLRYSFFYFDCTTIAVDGKKV